MSHCEIILIGNLGQDPELRFTKTGRAVCNFSLAVNRSWKDRASGEKQQETTWFQVSVWGDHAEVVNQHLTKGRQVLVVAHQIKANAFVRRDGTPGASLNVIAQTVRFLGSSSGGAQKPEDVWDDAPDAYDIPF